MTAGLRLLSWNVRDLLGDPLAVARVITSATPDVVCLQEAPRWPGSRWRLAALARACGLVVVGGGRSAAGTAVLASLRAGAGPADELRLPVEGRMTRPRGAVLVEVRPPSAPPLTVASVHLGLAPQERAQHVALLVARLRRAGGRVVVAGDLNETPEGPSWAGLAAVAGDATPASGPTFPAAAPRARIDAVLAGPGVLLDDPAWEPEQHDVLLASDHRPVLRVVG
ncbi:MAG: endonuclease/exonuclease/phosphatase family protein [Kineosporiaceae bacterium]